MKNLHIDVVRGERCVLVLVSDGHGKIRQYEYEQDADLMLSARDGMAKWVNGDENSRLENEK